MNNRALSIKRNKKTVPNEVCTVPSRSETARPYKIAGSLCVETRNPSHTVRLKAFLLISVPPR